MKLTLCHPAQSKMVLADGSVVGYWHYGRPQGGSTPPQALKGAAVLNGADDTGRDQDWFTLMAAPDSWICGSSSPPRSPRWGAADEIDR